jgi:hypothetical protein
MVKQAEDAGSDTDDWWEPEKCPPAVTAADGKTVLRRYYVKGVIYARTLVEARQALANADIYLDAAKITSYPDA